MGDLYNLRVLNIRNSNLVGSIQREIGNLTMLEELYFNRNNITGDVPSWIGNLTMLETLYLDDNHLAGSIPNEFRNLFKLVELGSGFNSLSGSIPIGIFNISTLTIFGLPHNNISGNLPPNMCHSLLNLEELYLFSNYLSGSIPVSSSNCSKLTILELSDNKFSGRIPNSLGDLRHLKYINLAENYLTSGSSSPELSLFTSLTGCIHLKKISMSYNPLHGILPTSIGNLSSSLERFYAENCGILGNVPESFGNLSNLIVLNLAGNHLTGSIPTTIRGLQKLQGLYLYDNNLGGSLPVDLCSLQSLNTLCLSYNHIFGPIPRCFSNLTALRILYLDSNRLTSTLPMSLWDLKFLLVIDLSLNSFVGSLPPNLDRLKVLTALYFAMNHFSGEIPASIGNLQDLMYLSLASNSLQGSIPATIGNMLSLESANLSDNNLSGFIPKSMEALKYLTYLNVSFNDLGGEIPFEGPFRNFTYKSFLFNKDLCGHPQFRYPQCKATPGNKSKKRNVFLPICILLGIVVIIGILAWGFVLFRGRQKPKVSDGSISALARVEARISYFELREATNGFDESNLLGTGSFGFVYKGVLENGLLVAVKVFNLQAAGGFKSFDRECDVLRNLRHRNLTRVITCCSNLDFKALVLEYMPNGSLEKWLYSHDCFLDVMQRLDIMIDVACALEYLHYGNPKHVVHCDLKPSNVLLDQDMVAHVSDFGIAKLLDLEDSITYTDTLATMGYIAPEYGLEGLVSTKSDIYSFGIMLMEVFTRKKPHDEIFGGDLSLRRWICESMPNSVEQVLDSNLLKPGEDCDEKLKSILSIMEVALHCSMDSPKERSNIEDALAALIHIKSRLLPYCSGS